MKDTDISRQTYWQKERRDDYLKRADALARDVDKKERLAVHQCVVCFYITGRVGGAAMTRSPCSICQKEMLFGSTCTSKLCPECAAGYGLCVHCGADIQLVQRRKGWCDEPF